jgi:NADPH-dependent curcumin reductase CurA
VRTLWQLVVKRLTMRGFLTYDHADRLAEADADLRRWVEAGALRPMECVYEGLAAAPQAFIDMMAGRTMGKTLVRV